MSISQFNFSNIQNTKRNKFNQVLQATQRGSKTLYLYDSLALKEYYDNRKKLKVEFFHAEYIPDCTEYQYDLELHIFFNWDALYKRELELASGDKYKLLDHGGRESGATLLSREEHYLNAVRIRWPERILPDGRASGGCALTPWFRDYVYGISNYNNVVKFGGGGQGKTYFDVITMVMMYDHFIKTKSGAQCSASTVSEAKLKSSIWSHINKAYSYHAGMKYKYSLFAGEAVQAPEYTYRRRNQKGKYIEEGGTMKGILLAQGRKSAVVIDKLTGQHDVVARYYCLDEAQSTDGAPLSAYSNMFLHIKPGHGLFAMNGNYERDGDLLSINAEPNSGWENVDETTHMWEGTVKSPDSNLGQLSLVIHYNNELSPGMTDPEMAKKYADFIPTPEKKKKLYPTKESLETYECKRMWFGFRHQREEEVGERVISSQLLEEYKCHEKPTATPIFILESVDTASSSAKGDRDIHTTFNIGVDQHGYPELSWGKITTIEKPKSQLEYYQRSVATIAELHYKNKIENGHSIIDWTQRTQVLEGLKDKGIRFHPIIYQQSCPSKKGENETTKIYEEPILLGTVPSFATNGIEKEIKVYAHDKIANRITLGAYICRMFIENGRIKGFNASILSGLECETFEKEFCNRFFKTHERKGKGTFIAIDSKEVFKDIYRFSPDILDTLFQVCYLLFVIFKVDPTKKGLGLLKKKIVKEVVADKHWYAKLQNRF